MGLKLFDLSGKIALVTGSSRGLGFTIAAGLGSAGATIILNGLEKKRLSNSVQKLLQSGIETNGYVFDVTDSIQTKKQIDAIEKDVGAIDILVNNAAVQIRGPLEDFDESKWDQILSINLTGIFHVSKHVVKSMIRRKAGKIINICSMQSELARPSIAPYTAAKGGVKMLTKAMATEWGKYNIQSNGIGPGYFITEMTRSLAEDESFDSWLRARTPANRWGTPEELIGSAIFLASKASDYVNGHILYVDGGMLACV